LSHLPPAHDPEPDGSGRILCISPGNRARKKRKTSSPPFAHLKCVKADVLVVGASPAGILAATSAAKEGAEVVLLDRDMGGTFDHPANTFFDGMFQRAGFAVERDYILHDLEGMHIISPSGHILEIQTPGRTIDRARFDELYLKRAEKAGVSLLRGTAKSAALSGEGRRVKIDFGKTETNSDKIKTDFGNIKTNFGEVDDSGDIEAKVVIDASGVEGAIAGQAGLSPLKHPEDVAWAAEAVVELSGLGEERFFEYWVGSISPGWKATFSPCGGDTATLGVFVRGRGKDVRPFLDRFIEFFKKYKSGQYEKLGVDVNDLEVLKVNRGGDAIAALPGDIVSDSLMATGAAAGQSGMAYAMRSGQICGKVAAKAASSGDASRKALSPYAKQWNREFYWEYRMGRASLETLRMMNDGDIDALTGGLERKDLNLAGSMVKKGISSGLSVLKARPKTVPLLVRNFLKG